MRARARVDQDQVRQLPTGEADLIVRGLGKRLRIIRTVVPGSAVEQARELVAGIARPRLRAPCPGTLRPNRDRPGRSPRVSGPPSSLGSAPATNQAGCFELDPPPLSPIRRYRPPLAGEEPSPEADRDNQTG